MATNPLRAESVQTNPLTIFSTFDRGTIASAVEVLIAVLDTLDGDPDLEPDGDETDGNGAEDEPCAWFATCGSGPGCLTADPDMEMGDI
jgi:hypothetical protein